MDCPICAEPFNRSNRKMIECHHCFFKACHACVGKFILGTDHAACMNCHKRWEDMFIYSQMTKAFIQNPYRQHIMDVLMRDIEPGLGGYQEIAVTYNERERVSRLLSPVRRQLDELEEKHNDRVSVEVIVDGRKFQLYHTISQKQTSAARYGSVIIRYVEGLVNPPSTVRDREQAAREEALLIRRIRHHQFHMKCAILNKNVFYTDQLHYATTPSITPSQIDLENIKKQLSEKKIQSHALYEQYLDGKDLSLSQWFQEVRVLYQKLWEQHFNLSPCTLENLLHILKGKDHYSYKVEEQKKNLSRAMWEKEDVWDRHNSNKKYIYNLDDRHLYPLHGTTIGKDVETVLEKEEQRWKESVEAYQEEMERLTARFKELQEQHKDLNKKLRMLNRNKTISGNYIISCPREGCRGKLVDDGQCGLCHQEYCLECLKEKETGHVCQQEDMETVRELRKTTRPCPQCGVLITKSDGCDQMWCVRCHTTFSWKSGAISYGVVHNPHFFNQCQQTTRTPGDIPCGGLPHEVEILRSISQLGGDRMVMYDIWDYCDQIAEEWMPRLYQKFHNVRAIKHRRYSIAYMCGKIDKKQLRVCLYRNYRDEIRHAHYYGLLETFVDNMAEFLRQFVRGRDTECECRALLTILGQDIQQMNKIFKTNVFFQPPIRI